MKKVAVVLSGCSTIGASELTETISTLIALSELGTTVSCFAPESGDFARQTIAPLSQLNEKDFDAVVFPGGTGAATILSDWAVKGSKGTVLPDVRRVMREFHDSSKPIGAICIAPTLLALVFGVERIEITIGDDAETATEIGKTGAQHTKCVVDDYVSDRDHKILTTPAYMYEHAKPHQVFAGIRRMLAELVEMA